MAIRLRGIRSGLLMAGVSALLVVVLGSPLLLAGLSGTGLPWDRLADVGDAFGGASALLSAIALCGIGASLLYQQRQIRQELVGMDRQQHVELLKLALDNPELIEVLNGEPAGPSARLEIYANLAMMYWLAIWELGEIDDEELRSLVAVMFRSAVMRNWWSRVGQVWIGARKRPDRVRFLSIISTELATAEIVAAKSAHATSGTRRRRSTGAVVLSVAAAGAVLGAERYLRGRRVRAGEGGRPGRPR